MKTLAKILLASVLMASACKPAGPATSDAADVGTWRTTRLLYHDQYALGEGLTKTQAQNRIGKGLSVTKDGTVKMGNRTCAEGRNVTTVPRAELLRSNKLLPPPGQTIDLGIPETVTVFNYSCAELWLRSDGNMVIDIDGYYFELHRTPQPKP